MLSNHFLRERERERENILHDSEMKFEFVSRSGEQPCNVLFIMYRVWMAFQ